MAVAASGDGEETGAFVAAPCEAFCVQVLGSPVAANEVRGGGALGLRLADGRRIVARRRPSPALAEIEDRLVRALHLRGAPVPGPLGRTGEWLFEEDAGATTLADVLSHAWEAEGERWLQLALTALARLHAAADAADLGRHAFAIGASAGWRDGLIATPARLGEFLGRPAPALDAAALRRRVDIAGSGFVKWDATPATAVVQPEWTVAWCDFAQAGRRHRLDDVVALLCAEQVPDWPVAEDRLLRGYLRHFDGGDDPAAAQAYLRVSGVLHTAVRLSSVLRRMLRDGAWDYDPVRGAGRPAPREVRHLCARGERWSAAEPVTAPLVPWWRELRDALRAAPPAREA